MSESKHNAAEPFRHYPIQKKSNTPSYKTMMNILESLVVCDNWLFFLAAQFYEFKTGPGVATSDNCTADRDSSVRVPPGE